MYSRLTAVMLLAGVVPRAIAAEPGFYLIERPSGATQGVVSAMTADGGITVGTNSNSSTPWYCRGFEWSVEEGRVEPQPEGLRVYSIFSGVSSDGLVISGEHQTSLTPSDRRAFVWNVGSPVVTLPLLAGYARAGSQSVSGDGLVLTGYCEDNSIPRRLRAFRWTAAGGIQSLPYASGSHNTSKPYAISRDGTTIVGESGSTGSGVIVGFAWTAGTGTVSLTAGGLTGGRAEGVNADGSVIVGLGHTATTEGAVYWDAQRQPTFLGSVGTFRSRTAHCVSDDGQIIGGRANTPTSGSDQGFIWTASGGMEFARDYFADRGAPVPSGWRVAECIAMSAGGRTIGGRAIHAAGGVLAYVAHLGPRCPADFNRDGGVDGGDVEAFFIAWEDSASTADVNEDGGVDGGDVETFFHAWEAGGCG